jgi:UPF0755 protein
MKRITLILVVGLVALLATAYLVFLASNPKSSLKEERIAIAKGSSLSQVADSLEAHHLLRSRSTFILAGKMLGAGKKLHAGLYRIAPGLSNLQMVQRLTGTEYSLLLQATFPEGITMYRAASIAREKLGLDSSIFVQYATDTAFLHGLGIPREARTAEGYLFPDTYQFLLSADPKSLVTVMVKRWKRIVLDSLWAQSEEENFSLHELMTFASIVEAEARVKSERDTIAGVYWNRIRTGMKLDADPTVQYGLHLTRPITHDDLQKPNPYNTYQNAGLPPGPICNPGAASIIAALHPAKHAFLYFVARRDGSGGHFFSRTLDDQSRMINIARRNAAGE